ncbi:uncharacterized protein LOC123558813 [Mercenaria mercenaria]|uniref:uncharacterized protein LOC123558813 n=1 Tax=Mercenaria mercenaria TaxID=6596 RepID=UPI00234F969E|nr:uncharacterized protein LOC123558813 [Mercenaria mercenaria]
MADSAKDSKSEKKGHENTKNKSSSSKGKAPLKKVPDDGNNSVPDDFSTRKNLQENAILECLKSIQSSQTALVKRIDDIEKSFDYSEDYDFDQDLDFRDSGNAPPAKRFRTESDHDSQTSACGNDLNSTSVSRFSSLVNKFQLTETTSSDVDSVLADNVFELFRKGMSEEHFDKMTKDESSARPSNCEALSEVRLNKLIWDVVSSRARTNDKKLQNIEKSIVKAGVFLTKTMDRAAKFEKVLTENDMTDGDMTGLIEGCNDALALIGHANYQVNMARRDFLRPELRAEYTHLCSHSLSFTSELFGDDVSKTAKEIEDCNKMGNRMHQSQFVRGRYRGRGQFRGQFRGGRRPAYGYGRGQPRFGQSVEPKNLVRRGARK